MYLAQKLVEYKDSGVYPMHMPGHKRNCDFFPEINAVEMDITEIDGFDNLHNPQAVIMQEEKRLSRLYGADKSIISVNGSTCGVLAAVFAATNDGDGIIMARNCHISVYRAAMLRKLHVEYIHPKTDLESGICNCITVDEISLALEKCPKAKAVILTSPTYEGVVSDITEIARLVHKNKMLLIVDEAHGAHFIFSDSFPKSAVTCGADIVINSLHKTLPCFTGGAVIHINGSDVICNKVKSYMDIFETSSPSYLIMASISHCMSTLESRGKELFESYVKKLDKFYDGAGSFNNLSLFSGGYAFDRGKIVVSTTGCSIDAAQLYEALLKKYKIQCEMYSLNYIICMTSVADTDEGFDRLLSALSEIDSQLTKVSENENVISIPRCHSKHTMHECNSMKKAILPVEKAVGRVAGDFVFAYPPGVPVIVPGEVITSEAADAIQKFISGGVVVSDSDGIISQNVSVLDIDNS